MSPKEVLEFAKKNDAKQIDLDKRIAILREKLPEKTKDATKEAKKEEDAYEKSLEEKKKLYVAYQKWIDAYGKASADEQYAELLKDGIGYIDFLEKEIAKVEAKKVKGKLSDKDTKNFDTLNSQLIEAKGGETQLDNFKNGLKEAKDLVDGAPATLKEGMKKAEAEEVKKKIEEAGGKIELK